MVEKILVTGGCGYVGSFLVPLLLKKGLKVRVYDTMWFGKGELDKINDEKLDIYQGDIRDYNKMDEVLKGIDKVIHLAAISNDPCSDLNPELTKEVNYDSIKEIVSRSKNLGVNRFILASSSSVYGIKEEGVEVTEDLDLEPITLYSKLKAESEKVLFDQVSEDFVGVGVRSATVCGYSPRTRLDVIVNILSSDAINKRSLTVFGGNQKRPNVYIEDICDFYYNLLNVTKEKINGEVFNYGGKNYSVIQIADIVKEVVGNDVNIEWKDIGKDNRSYSISSKKAFDVLGLCPKKDVREGVESLKSAFNYGEINNYKDTIYRNIEHMKKLGVK